MHVRVNTPISSLRFDVHPQDAKRLLSVKCHQMAGSQNQLVSLGKAWVQTESQVKFDSSLESVLSGPFVLSYLKSLNSNLGIASINRQRQRFQCLHWTLSAGQRLSKSTAVVRNITGTNCHKKFKTPCTSPTFLIIHNNS